MAASASTNRRAGLAAALALSVMGVGLARTNLPPSTPGTLTTVSTRLVGESLRLELTARPQGEAYILTIRLRNTGGDLNAVTLAGYESDHEIVVKDSQNRAIYRCRPDPKVGNVLMPRALALKPYSSYGYSCVWRPKQKGAYTLSGFFDLYEPTQERLTVTPGVLVIR